MMSKKRKIILIVIFVLLFLASVCVVAYPLVSNLQTEKQKDAIVLAYREAFEDDASISDELAAARAYNDALSNGQTADSDYDALLDPNGTGMMGIVSIPAIGVELPIYHGTQSLSLGAVHLQGTSLPVGGENTNAVLGAHRGRGGEDYLRNIEKVQIGDEILATNLWETLHYAVVEIKIIKPDEISQILVQPDRDLLTVFTCHPYGSSGRYRYLLICERAETNNAIFTEKSPNYQSNLTGEPYEIA